MMEIDNWNDIIGHEEIKKDLQILVNKNKLPHALLFAGIEGIGKRLIAEFLAKLLLCKSNTANDDCTSCRVFSNENHPDYYYLYPEVKKIKVIKIEQIRKMQEGISLAPYMSDKQVVVIDGAEYMNDVAANSLLKILEEPIGQVYFILLTSNKDMLLSTILSRCMKLYFAPLNFNEVAYVLEKKQNVEKEKANIIAKLSGGSISKAMEFLQEDVLKLRITAIDFLTASIDAREIWSLSDKISNMERKEVIQWVIYLQMVVHDLLLMNTDINFNNNLLYNIDIKEKLLNLQHRYTVQELFDKLNLINDLLRRLNSNADVKLMLQRFMLQWRK